MESTDVLNQIRRSITKSFWDAVGVGESKSTWRGFHFRLADAMDRRRFEFWQVKLGPWWHEDSRNINFPARVVGSLQRLHFQFPAFAHRSGHDCKCERENDGERERQRTRKIYWIGEWRSRAGQMEPTDIKLQLHDANYTFSKFTKITNYAEKFCLTKGKKNDQTHEDEKKVPRSEIESPSIDVKRISAAVWKRLHKLRIFEGEQREGCVKIEASREFLYKNTWYFVVAPLRNICRG